MSELFIAAAYKRATRGWREIHHEGDPLNAQNAPAPRL